MILKSISLKNFRKFKDSSIEFPDGVTGIVGLNGVGKSTLFEAFAWVLYGPVATRTGADQIKREGAAISDPCRVEIEFIFDDDTYRVVREMSGKNLQVSGIVTLNGKIAANGAELVCKFIQRKLGMDWKSFYTSIFAKQKELNTLSSMNPSERRQLILRMLGINAVDDVISEIRLDIKEKKHVIEKLGFDLLDAQGNEKITVYTQELQLLEKKQKELIKHIEEQKKKGLTIEAELHKIKKDYDTKKQSYEKIYTIKEQLEEKKTKFEKRLSLEVDIETQEKTLQERQAYLEKQNVKLTLFKTLEKDLLTLEQQQQKNYDSIQTVIKKQEQNRTIMHRLGEDIRELTIKKQQIEKIGPQAKCPTCERVLGEQQHKLLKLYSEEIVKKNCNNQKLVDVEKKFTNEYERLTREKQALQKKKRHWHHYLKQASQKKMRC